MEAARQMMTRRCACRTATSRSTVCSRCSWTRRTWWPSARSAWCSVSSARDVSASSRVPRMTSSAATSPSFGRGLRERAPLTRTPWAWRLACSPSRSPQTRTEHPGNLERLIIRGRLLATQADLRISWVMIQQLSFIISSDRK